VLRWQSHGAVGLAGVAYITEFSGSEAGRSVDENEVAPLATRYSFRGRSGTRYRLRQMAAVVPDAMHHEPDLQAIRLLFAGSERGFDRLRDENSAAWQDIWQGRIQVDAPARWQAMLDAAYFYLQTSVPRFVAREYVAVWARLLAGLPLLPRSRHVGHRDVRRSATRTDEPGCRPVASRIQGGAPAGRSQ
jgi:trehalose/maltose hydrolase-like predicted phosphorylase